MKTMILAGILAFGATGAALAHGTLAHTFAECAGRFSAEMEHAWLMNDPGADEHAADRASFVGLTSASMSPEDGRSILGHRVAVKLAHAALLQQATFATSPRHAQSARQVANTHLAACRQLRLGS